VTPKTLGFSFVLDKSVFHKEASFQIQIEELEQEEQ
jgi:hypothetical protein